MSVGGVSNNSISRRISQMRQQLDILNAQLGTGIKSTTYRDLGAQRYASINAHSRLASIDSFRQTIDTIDVRLNIASTTLTRFSTISSSQSSDNMSSSCTPADGSQTVQQKSARLNLDEVFSLLNQDVNGRRLFSGRATDKDAALSVSVVLDGDTPKAGLREVITERAKADLGADTLGRLSLTAPAANQAQLGNTNGVFGFKLANISNGLANTTTTDTAGPPRNFNIAFTGQPNDGEGVQIGLTQPDGSVTSVRLRATTSATAGSGEFVVGATPNATAANFRDALGLRLQQAAKTELRAASAAKASADFFNVSEAQKAQRVNIVTTAEAATGLRDATATDTVQWYQGDAAVNDPRSTATARVDNQLTLGYGMRATEQPIRTLAANLAIFAAVQFDPADATSPDAYNSLKGKVQDNLGKNNSQGLISIQQQIAGVHTAAQDAQERHISSKSIFDNILGDIESVSKEDVATEILDLQTRLQATYQVTANLSKLSLVNYI